MINEQTRVLALVVILSFLLIGGGLMTVRLGQAFREIKSNTEAREQALARIDNLDSQIQEIIRTTNDIGARVEKALADAPPVVILEQLVKTNQQTQASLDRIFQVLEGSRQDATNREAGNRQ